MPVQGKTLEEAIEKYLGEMDAPLWRSELARKEVAEHLAHRLKRDFMQHCWLNAFSLIGTPRDDLLKEIGMQVVMQLAAARNPEAEEYAHTIDTEGIRFPAAFMWWNAS